MKRTVVIVVLFLAWSAIPTSQVELGEKVANFTALNQDGEKWVLKKELKTADYLVVYFYPAAFTGGCTKEACAYRDQKGELEKVGANVVGISGDEPKNLYLFALEHSLNFTLLSDLQGEIATQFGVPHSDGTTIQKEIQGKNVDLKRGTTIQRWTFILDKDGMLIYKDSEVNAAEDSNKVFEFLASLN